MKSSCFPNFPTHLSNTALPCAPTAKSISSSPSRSKRVLTLRPKYCREGERDDPGMCWNQTQGEVSLGVSSPTGVEYKHKNYLLVIGVDVNAVSMVDVDGPPVLVLQWGSHHQVSEAVVIEVRSSCQCVTKPGILGLFFRFKSAVRYKHLLLEDEPEKEMAKYWPYCINELQIIAIDVQQEINGLLLPEEKNKCHSRLTPVKE